MTLLVALLAVFAAVHVVPAIPKAKAAAQGALGKSYGAAYGIASFVLLALCIWAFRQADPGHFYDPPSWGRHANFLFTLVAFLFIGIFLARGSWRNAVRYPMAIAVVFWAMGHLLANGEARSVTFIVGLALAALLHALLAARLTAWNASDERGGHNMLSILFGLALYGLMAQLHGALLGMPVIDLSGYAP